MNIKRFKYFCLSIVLLSFFLFYIVPSNALFRGFGPDSYPDGKTYGIGVFFAPKLVTIYSEPNENSKIVETLQWEANKVQLESSASDLDDPRYSFIAFYPYDDVAVMTALDDVNGWVNVVYDQKNKLSGWVKSIKNENKADTADLTNKFYPWLEFLHKFAKSHMIYFISGVPKKYRNLRTAPNDEASQVATETTYIKSLQLKHIRGNWMLVKAMDFDNTSPIGWLRWRDDEGRILIFLDFITNK